MQKWAKLRRAGTPQPQEVVEGWVFLVFNFLHLPDTFRICTYTCFRQNKEIFSLAKLFIILYFR